jgi:putative tricarboxylic transport membrane protein
VRRADQVAGLALLLLGAGFAAGGAQHSYWGPGGPGSGFLPVWLGAVMAVLALMLLVQATRSRDAGGAWLPRGAGLRRLAAVLGVTVVFVALLKIVGMTLGTVLFLIVILRVVEGHRWASTLGIALAVAAVNYLVFTYWLRVPFPTGLLGL